MAAAPAAATAAADAPRLVFDAPRLVFGVHGPHPVFVTTDVEVDIHIRVPNLSLLKLNAYFCASLTHELLLSLNLILNCQVSVTNQIFQCAIHLARSARSRLRRHRELRQVCYVML